MLYLFGDESLFESVVTYAIVSVEAGQVEAVDQALAEAKMMFGGVSDLRIHCRELFHHHPRQKSRWNHLGLDEAFELAIVAGNLLRRAGLRSCFAGVERAGLPDVLRGPLRVITSSTVIPLNIPTGPKQLARLAYTAAMGRFIGQEFKLCPTRRKSNGVKANSRRAASQLT